MFLIMIAIDYTIEEFLEMKYSIKTKQAIRFVLAIAVQYDEIELHYRMSLYK